MRMGINFVVDKSITGIWVMNISLLIDKGMGVWIMGMRILMDNGMDL